MPFRHRRPLLAAVVTLVALGAGATSAGASIVYTHAGQIWTMNDNGSGRQLLLTPDDAGLTFKDKEKGNDSLGNPSIAPDGTTLMFAGTTRRNHFTRVGLCGTFPYQYSCFTFHEGFNGTVPYRWKAGKITRLGGDPAYCFDCTSLEVDPEVRSDETYVSKSLFCQGYQDTSYNCAGAIRDTSLPGDDKKFQTRCDGFDAEQPTPSPAKPSEVAYGGCQDDQQHGLLIVSGPNRAGERTVSCDDQTIGDPSWSPDGQRLVDVERGTDPGLWAYDSAQDACAGASSAQHLLKTTSEDVFLSTPRYVGADQIVFSASVTAPTADDANHRSEDLYVIPAGCNACTFPDDAKRLTDDGQSSDPTWTAKDLFEAVQPAVPPVAPVSRGGPLPTRRVPGDPVSSFRRIGSGPVHRKARLRLALSRATPFVIFLQRKRGRKFKTADSGAYLGRKGTFKPTLTGFKPGTYRVVVVAFTSSKLFGFHVVAFRAK